METTEIRIRYILGLQIIAPLRQIAHGVYGDLIMIYPKPYAAVST